MKVTKALVKHLVEKLGLDAKYLEDGCNENEVRAFASEKMASGELEIKTVAELTAEKELSEAEKMVQKAVNEAVVGTVRPEIETAIKSFSENITKMIQGMGTQSVVAPEGEQTEQADTTTTTKGLGVAGEVISGASEVEARVKSMDELYDTTRSTLTYKSSQSERNRKVFGDAPVVGSDGAPMNTQSQLDKAIASAWFKKMVMAEARRSNTPLNIRFTDRDKALVHHALEKSAFTGPVGSYGEDSDGAQFHLEGVKLSETVQPEMITKALLDDGTSGGLEAVPIEFDNAVIMTPLLEGELYPLITWRPTSRRRIEAYSMGEVTFDNTAEGTAGTLFNTAGFIAALDTTINPVTGFMEVGADFMEDSPNNMLADIRQRYGSGFRKEMDRQIAVGSGSGELLGLTQTAGIANIAAANAAIPYSTSDAEALLFGVGKEYRDEAGASAVYLSSETVYSRFRGIPHGTDDERRVMGMNQEDYRLMGHSYRIQNSVGAAVAGFFCLNYYRGYRRRGFSINIESGGKTLTLANQRLISLRARYGGQLSLAGAGAIIDDLPVT